MLVESYLYEPANTKSNTNDINIYIPQVHPENTHLYNSAFARNDSSIIINKFDCVFNLFQCARPDTTVDENGVMNVEVHNLDQRVMLIYARHVQWTLRQKTATSETLYFCIDCYAEENTYLVLMHLAQTIFHNKK